MYPSSLNVAAAAPPASPEPTTITVYFRLFAGFTSFMSKRCRSHFSGSGPGGVFDFSSRVIYRIAPRNTAMGMMLKPSHTTTAMIVATRRCSGWLDGLERPSVRTELQAP